MSLAVTEIAWGRADQFRDFVGVLEFRAIDLDDRARIAEQNLGGSLNNAGLARTGRPEKQQIAHRASRRIQASAENLEHIHQRLYAFFLPHNLRTQRAVKVPGVVAADCRVQLLSYCGSH